VSLLDYPDFRALALMLFGKEQLKEDRVVKGNFTDLRMTGSFQF